MKGIQELPKRLKKAIDQEGFYTLKRISGPPPLNRYNKTKIFLFIFIYYIY